MDELPKGKNYPPEIADQFKYFVSLTETVVPHNPVKFKGKIYLLIDGGVYSAAESFASFAKSTGWATLVGTTTGGDGIIADPALMMLPNSGIVVRFSSSMGLNIDGTVNEEYHTTPDMYVEQDYEDFQKQIENNEVPLQEISQYDTVLNTVLNMIEKNR
ncbi:MAG: Prc2 [Clostridia bacterium]|nr:Prc2 [Clostridia bacterium]